MTETSRYDALVDRVGVLYTNDQLREAIELLETESTGLEVWAAELAHLKACVLGAAGNANAALQTLQDASDAGAWWRPSILTDDDDLAALRGQRQFEQLVEVSRDRVTDDPTPPLVALSAEAPTEVVVALHGAGQRAGHAQQDWSGVLKLGKALVCVESSQRMSPMYRTWPDRDSAAADIARALGQLPAELSGVPMIAAGFSAGGRAALDWALTAQPQPAAGVVVMAPALRELPRSAAGRLSPATVLIGTDDDLLDEVDEAADQLIAFGCTIQRLPGLGHTFPADFAERLAAILA